MLAQLARLVVLPEETWHARLQELQVRSSCMPCWVGILGRRVPHTVGWERDHRGVQATAEELTMHTNMSLCMCCAPFAVCRRFSISCAAGGHV